MIEKNVTPSSKCKPKTIAMICLRLKGNKAFYSKYEIVSLIYQLEI